MRYAVDPKQNDLFDTTETMFSAMAINHMKNGWHGIFRSQILHLMPVEKIGNAFHPTLGQPTKELYAMAGTIFLKEFFNLTIEQTVERSLTDVGWHYALNVNTLDASMSHATVERYMKIFVEQDAAADIFHRVTSALIEALELDVSRQRLDSTHVFSDMATFGRSKLMGVTIKRFLTQLKRHDRQKFEALPDEFRSRYAPSQAKMFADFNGGRQLLRQQVAEDLLVAVNRFADEKTITKRPSYQAMARVLDEQCDVSETKTSVAVKAKTGGNVMQNPSDPDATYDGHKGPGYQVQIAETCSEKNDVQLITAPITEPAHKHDGDAVAAIIDTLDEHNRTPEIIFADGAYGSDDNVQAAGEKGVDLQSPVAGLPPQQQKNDKLTIDDFVIDEDSETVERCPAGHAPESSTHDKTTEKTITKMPAKTCSRCEFFPQCPISNSKDRNSKSRHGKTTNNKLGDGGVANSYTINHSAADRRLAARRAEQATAVFAENYAIRAGGESVNSGLKRRTGFGRVRTRGRPRMTMKIFLKCAGWNMFRALSALKKRKIRNFQALLASSCHVCLPAKAQASF